MNWIVFLISIIILIIFLILIKIYYKLNIYKKFYRYNFWDKRIINSNRTKYLRKGNIREFLNNPLFQTYYNKSKIPVDIYYNIKKYASEYTHIIMDDRDIELFLKKYYNSNVLTTFKSLKLGAHKADLARYCILYIYGGLYMDIKVELIKPLSDIFVNDDVLYSVISNDKDHIHQGIIKSPPNNPLFLSLIDYIVSTNNPGDYIDFCRDMYIQIKKDIGYIKESRSSFSGGKEGVITGKSGNKYYLFKEKIVDKLFCYDGPDQYGYCCFVFNGEEKIIKTRRSSYPWK